MKVVRMSLKKGEISRFQQSGSAWILRKKKNVVGRLSINEPVKVCDSDLINAPWDEITHVYCIARVEKIAFDKDSPDDVMVHLVLLEVLTPVQLNRDVEPIEYGIQL